jgi:replicative DNA helicase
MRQDEIYRLEAIVLGTLIRNASSPQARAVRLRPDDFSDRRHKTIFAAFHAAMADGREIDPFELETRLNGLIENPLAEVAGLFQAAGAVENLPDRVKALRKAGRSTRLQDLLSRASVSLAENRHDADAVRARLLERLIGLEDDADRDDVFTLEQAAVGAIDEIEMAFQARDGNRPIGVPTGLEKLDSLSGGLRKSDLIVVGARPAMGKTAWMVSAALNAARRGKRIGLISTEMSATQLATRFASLLSHVPAAKFRTGDLEPEDCQALTAGMAQVKDLPIRICDNPSMTVSDVLALAKSWALTGGLDALFIDYLQRLKPEGRQESRTLEVGRFAEGLKTIARRLDIPVVALAQLNRGVEHRDRKRPHMGDIRDSGMIEQEADMIVFLHRPWVYDHAEHPSKAEMLVGKNRHGETAIIECTFDPETMRWTA